jgi:hypothetical protein
MSIKRKLIHWLFKKSRRLVRDNQLERTRCDIKCPNCREWFSVSAVDYKHEHVSQPEWGFHVKCGQCSYESYWNSVAAPVLLRCNDKGSPL